MIGHMRQCCAFTSEGSRNPGHGTRRSVASLPVVMRNWC